ncbi:hypothetical protein DIPPA_06624 [Diplonema papillatum]|nr:hypothetical protein DIPPA_06624 [Diplonema papillatum]
MNTHASKYEVYSTHLTPPQPSAAAVPLSQRREFDYFRDASVHQLPFFRAAWAARLRRIEVAWLGIPPWLFESRARNKTLTAEWDRNAGLERCLSRESAAPEDVEASFRAFARERSRRLTPQEVVSDLNMRFVVKKAAAIKRHLRENVDSAVAREKGFTLKIKETEAKPVTLLVVVPATEHHLFAGWCGACDSLTSSSINECVDPLLDVVPSLQKATKSPEFLSVERAVHVDTLCDMECDSAAVELSQDPRLANVPDRHNPHAAARFSPSPALRVLQVGPTLDDTPFLHSGQTTKEHRAGLRASIDGTI